MHQILIFNCYFATQLSFKNVQQLKYKQIFQTCTTIFDILLFFIFVTLKERVFLKPNEYNFIIMLKEIIISVLLIRLSFPLTSTTFNNCPTQFEVANYNTTSSSANQGLADSLYSNLFSSQSQLKIKASLDSGDLGSLQEQIFSIDFMLPYIVIASIFGLLFILTICCCTFDRRCPPCESWRRNYLKEPYSKIELRATMITAIVFSAGILVTTIVVFSSFSTINKDIEMVKCGLFYSLDVALNGDQDNNWGGFSRVQSQIQNISGQLGAAASTITTTMTDNEWIITGMQAIKDMNLALWTDNKNSEAFTPNPVTTKAATNSQADIPKIVPYFIKQYLGPYGKPNTMTTDIDTGLQITQKLSDQAYIVYKSSINLANSASSIVVNTNSNLKSISIATSYLSKITQSVQSFQQKFIQIVLQKGIYIIQAIFGFILLASLISLIGIVSTHLFQLLTCKKIVNGGWVLFGFMYFAILLVLFIFLSIGGLSYSFCEHLGGIINSSVSFNKFIAAPDSGSFNKFFEYLDVCFFSDGDILQKFQVSNQMKSVSQVFLNIQKFTNMQTAGNTVYIDTTVAPTKVLSWMNKMNEYSQGKIYDGSITDLSQDNPHVSLANFNKITNSDTVGSDTVCAKDVWTYDVVNCTYGPTQSIFSPSSDMTNGLYFSPTGTICISLNSRISTSAPSIWTASDIAQRYLSVRSCKLNSENAYAKILDYAASLTNYRDSRINLYKGISDQLSDLQLLLNDYSSNMSDFTTKTSTFFSSASALNNLVTNQLNGLVISSNCTIIANSLRFFYNMYCVNFLYRSIKVVICCVLLLVFMIASVVVGGIFATRYSRVEKVIKFKGTDSQSELFKDDNIQKTESSASSNSQEQNQ